MSEGKLSGKTALVTGGGSHPAEQDGVPTGSAMARLFAAQGADVTIVDLDRERGEHTAQVIGAESGRQCLVLPIDVTSAADCESAITRTVQEFGRIDVLVNNVATIRAGGGAADTSEEDWDMTVLVNLKSAFLMTKYAVPAMIAGGGGSIVNISSIGAERGFAQCAYSTTKAAMNALTKDTAMAYASQGVRANAIEPGWINTPMSNRHRSNLSPEERRAVYEQRRLATPLRTEGTGSDIANAALFLVSDEGRWITGHVLPVDGGVLAMAPSQTTQSST